jgi:benzoyl-CoA reductase/2-hydroxyglutaryl-CoA dehydratase subunit BcrC/BadD/HgdB
MMNAKPAQITLAQWNNRYAQLRRSGLCERFYGGPLSRHAEGGDTRLIHLRFDNSAAALALWNLLLTENDRLHRMRAQGKKIIGAMKDLGTVPVLSAAFDNLAAFYPDGAWWTPCLMEQNEGLFELASRIGLDDTLCPVRAMAAAFVNAGHFPIPDISLCSAGAVCDDFSVIAQRLEQLGFPIRWWEIPRRRNPLSDEPAVCLPGNLTAPASQVAFVRTELQHVASVLEHTAGTPLDWQALRDSIRRANRFRRLLSDLRTSVYTANPCPMGAIEMLIAEMLALHYCSDYEEAVFVIENLLAEVRMRIQDRTGVLPPDAARVFWINPAADLQAMNLLEASGARLCGTEFLFSHALDPILEDCDPLESLARTALADPMVGPAVDRAARICRDIVRFGAEGVVIARIPGASHCAFDLPIIGAHIRDTLGLPVVEIEIPTLCDSADASILTRLEALVENIKQRRHK